MMDHTVELHLGMVTTGMLGDLITTATDTGFTIRPSLTRNQTDMVVLITPQVMDITIRMFTTARLVATMDILICTLDCHITVILMGIIRHHTLTTTTTTTQQVMQTLMLLLTMQVVLEGQVEQEHQPFQAQQVRKVQLVQQEVLVQLAVVVVVVLYL
jgi:hypothetical protein